MVHKKSIYIGNEYTNNLCNIFVLNVCGVNENEILSSFGRFSIFSLEKLSKRYDMFKKLIISSNLYIYNIYFIL